MKLWKPAVLGTALMALLMLGMRMTAAVPASGWGLSFPVPGQPPAGPLGPEKLDAPTGVTREGGAVW